MLKQSIIILVHRIYNIIDQVSQQQNSQPNPYNTMQPQQSSPLKYKVDQSSPLKSKSKSQQKQIQKYSPSNLNTRQQTTQQTSQNQKQGHLYNAMKNFSIQKMHNSYQVDVYNYFCQLNYSGTISDKQQQMNKTNKHKPNNNSNNNTSIKSNSNSNIDIKQTQKSPKSEPSNQKTLIDFNNLLNKLLAYSYDQQSKFSTPESTQQQLQDDITKFFDMLLWAEKKCPELLYSVFDMQALQQIQNRHIGDISSNNKYNSCLNTFFKAYILILGNCQEGGLLAEAMLDAQLVSQMLHTYGRAVISNQTEDKQEIIQYIGSYLKCYHKLFRPQWFKKFIINGSFQLLQICLQFITCPEPLTQTSIMNLILDLFHYVQVQQFILAIVNGQQQQTLQKLGIRKQQSKQHYELMQQSSVQPLIQLEPSITPILSLQKSHSFHCPSIYTSAVQTLTKSFKNSLAQFCLRIAHFSPKDSINDILVQLDDKISLWEDISASCGKLVEIFILPFVKNVIMPLLVSPLNPKIQGNAQEMASSLFTLKFSLFVLWKLMKVIKNFGILSIFIQIIFGNQDVYYWPSELNKSIIRPFSIQQVFMEKHKVLQVQPQQQSQSFGQGIKNFFQSLLRSKDNHFILISTSFLNSLYLNFKQSSESIPKQFSLDPNSSLSRQICQRLLDQLAQGHRLIAIEAILNTIIIFQDDKPFSHANTSLTNIFVHIYRKHLQQLKKEMKAKNQFWEYLVQVNQYQIRRIDSVKFGSSTVLSNEKLGAEKLYSKRFQQVFKVVFLWDVQQQEQSVFSFYIAIPDTIQEHFRYLYSKFLLFRRARFQLLQVLAPIDPDEPVQGPDLVPFYNKRFPPSSYVPGAIFSLKSFKSPIFQCSIVENKTQIPAIWIQDPNYFTLAFFNKPAQQARIILSIQFKHVTAELKTKKDKIWVQIEVRGYNFKSERVKNINDLNLKNFESIMVRMVANQVRQREKELIWMMGVIKTADEGLPAFELL